MTSDRDRFGAEELAVCLSHYDLGLLHSVREFPRGSRRAPKVLVDCQRGRFLFKRRARGKDEATRVAFTHQIQLALAAQNFPLPHLVGTRDDNNSMLVLDGRIYEMFEFIAGSEYPATPQATFDAGRTLGLYHKLLRGFRSDFNPVVGSYHASAGIHKAIQNTVNSLPADTRPPLEVVSQTVGRLEDAYRRCARGAETLGLGDWPTQIVHGDWHPGNMLFRHNHVAAVIDYDSARLQQRVIDLANGALQFSILGGSPDPLTWPPNLDLGRLGQFIAGYDAANVITRREMSAIPLLMCEAMIAEAVLPIAATGSFGRMDGFPFLKMIENKVDWIVTHIDDVKAAMQ